MGRLTLSPVLVSLFLASVVAAHGQPAAPAAAPQPAAPAAAPTPPATIAVPAIEGWNIEYARQQFRKIGLRLRVVEGPAASVPSDGPADGGLCNVGTVWATIRSVEPPVGTAVAVGSRIGVTTEGDRSGVIAVDCSRLANP